MEYMEAVERQALKNMARVHNGPSTRRTRPLLAPASKASLSFSQDLDGEQEPSVSHDNHLKRKTVMS